MSLLKSDIIQRNPQILSAAIDVELLLLDVPSGKYLSLNPIAAEIWGMLEQPIRLDALYAALHAAFNGEPDAIEADALRFIEDLDARGMLLRPDSR